MYSIFCCIVCSVELVVNVGGLINNWYWLVYVDASTIFIPSFISLPFIFNELLIVEAPDTIKLEKLVLLNIVVLVAFKFLIDKVEFVDKLKWLLM